MGNLGAAELVIILGTLAVPVAVVLAIVLVVRRRR